MYFYGNFQFIKLTTNKIIMIFYICIYLLPAASWIKDKNIFALKTRFVFTVSTLVVITERL